MQMIRIQLNKAIHLNYVFCDPEAGVHLSMMSPVGLAHRLTPSILRGLKGKTIIDVDGVVDVEKGVLKSYSGPAAPSQPKAQVDTDKKVEAPPAEVKTEVPVAEVPVEKVEETEVTEEATEEDTEDKTAAKKTTKGKK